MVLYRYTDPVAVEIIHGSPQDSSIKIILKIFNQIQITNDFINVRNEIVVGG